MTSGLTTRAQTFSPRRDPSQGSSQDATISTSRTRQYDPATGSWLQEDHAGIAGGINLYQYNGNDPNTFGDPFGLCDKIAGTTAPCEFFAVVMGEARGASAEMQLAVANVIKNRVSVSGGDYGRVINQRQAFSSMSGSDNNRKTVDATMAQGSVTDAVRDLVEGVFTGKVADNTAGALLYYSPQAMSPKGSAPRWNMKLLKNTLDLGNEGQFYACKKRESCWTKP